MKNGQNPKRKIAKWPKSKQHLARSNEISAIFDKMLARSSEISPDLARSSRKNPSIRRKTQMEDSHTL